MKVKELIRLLEQADMKAEVILSSDSEGNRYGQLSSVSVASMKELWDTEVLRSGPKRGEAVLLIPRG